MALTSMSVQVTLKEDPKPAKLYAMRFDADGKVQKTSMASSTSERVQLRRGDPPHVEI